MPKEEEKVQIKFKLKNIPLNQCKLFEIKGEKIVVCNDNGEFSFYKLKPLKEIMRKTQYE